MPNYKKSDNRTWRGDTTRVGHDPMGDPEPNLSHQTHLALAIHLRRRYILRRAPVVRHQHRRGRVPVVLHWQGPSPRQRCNSR